MEKLRVDGRVGKLPTVEHRVLFAGRRAAGELPGPALLQHGARASAHMAGR